MLPIMSGTGRLTEDPQIRFSGAGNAVATISLAFNSRKLNRDTGEWEDDSVFFVRATAFKGLAENAVDTLKRGMEVVVTGRLKTDQWQDKQSGENRSAVSLLLDSIGPNLDRATATVTKTNRPGGSETGGNRQPAYSGGGAEDPWGAGPDSPSTSSEPAPF